MELTPIKIRGKRSKTLGSKRGRGRPSKSASTSAASSAVPSRASTPVSMVSKASARSLRSSTAKRRKTAKPLSRLEELPIELLQIIFLESMNVALPRSSPHLAAMLSDEHTRLEFSLRAFYCNGLLLNDNSADMPRLHSELLACRFFTWSYFQVILRRVHERYVKEHKLLDDEHLSACSNIFCPHSFFPVAADDWKVDLWKVEHTPYLQMGAFQIPEKVLHGPWTSDKVEFLSLLVKLNGRVDWEDTSTGEVATQGLYDAIRQGSTEAVEELFHENIRVIPKTEMVRVAVMDCDFDERMVYSLLCHADCDDGDVDYYDSKLWAWIEHASSSGDPKGALLKEMLLQADKRDLRYTVRSQNKPLDL